MKRCIACICRIKYLKLMALVGAGVMLMVCSYVASVAFAETATSLFPANAQVYDYESLKAAIDAAPTDGAKYYIEVMGDFEFTGPALVVDSKKNIILFADPHNQHTVTQRGGPYNGFDALHFLVRDDITADGSIETTLMLWYLILDGANTGGGVSVNCATDERESSVVGHGGNIHINKGAVIQNCYTSNEQRGGGVTVYKGAVVIDGGKIIRCTKNAASGGGGLYAGHYSAILMRGGEISGNTGGGVSVTGTCSFYLYNSVVSNNTSHTNGGGIYYAGSMLMISGSEITGNSAGGRGGGLYTSPSVKTTITGSVVENNTAYDSGGGIYAVGALSLTGSTIRGNRARTGSGGGIYADATGRVTTNGEVAIADNYAHRNGGGVFALGGSSMEAVCTITVESGTTAITGNTASLAGGGLYCVGDSKALANAVTNENGVLLVNGNTAETNGGGVFMAYSTLSSVEGSIDGNTAIANGGGLYAIADVTVNFVRGSVSGNSAMLGYGGGLYVNTACTISIKGRFAINSNNAKGHGGGIYMYCGPAPNTMCHLFMEGSTVEVCHNTAGFKGGGIHTVGSSISRMNTIATVNGRLILSNNRADEHGGGLHSSHSIISITALVNGNRTSGDGGGIYIDTASKLTLYADSAVTANEAVNGGGLFTLNTGYGNLPGDYANLNLDSTTVFSQNIALTGYVPPVDAVARYPNIGFSQVSIADHPLNHYDINYAGRVPFSEFDIEAEGPGLPAKGTTLLFTIYQLGADNTVQETRNGCFIGSNAMILPFTYSEPANGTYVLYAAVPEGCVYDVRIGNEVFTATVEGVPGIAFTKTDANRYLNIRIHVTEATGKATPRLGTRQSWGSGSTQAAEDIAFTANGTIGVELTQKQYPHTVIAAKFKQRNCYAAGNVTVAAGTRVTGNLFSKLNIYVNGTVYGNVSAEGTIYIGAAGAVTGTMIGTVVYIY